MLAVIAILAVQALFAALLFGTVVLDRHHEVPRVVELRRRVR